MGRKRVITLALVSLIVLSASGIGLRLTRDPVDLVSVTLDKKEVSPNEKLTLRINNHGFKPVWFGSRYELYQKYDDGTVRKIMRDPNYAWTAERTVIAPIIGSYSQNIYTDLEQGHYFVSKEVTIVDVGEYSKTAEFTIK